VRKRSPHEGLANLASFLTCPAGHQLPNEIPGIGSCTSATCVGAAAVPAPKTRAKEDLKDHAEEREFERGRMRQEQINEMVPVPEGLEGADAEEWVRKALVEAGPYAVQRLVYTLKHGEESEALRAAERVLKSIGFGDKQALGGGGSLIIIQGLPANGVVPLSALPFATVDEHKAQMDSLEDHPWGKRDA